MTFEPSAGESLPPKRPPGRQPQERQGGPPTHSRASGNPGPPGRQPQERQGEDAGPDADGASHAAAGASHAAPGAAAPQTFGRPPPQIPVAKALWALAAALLIAVLLLLFLPDRPTVAPLPEQPAGPQVAPYEAAKRKLLQEEASELGRAVLRAQLALEDLGAALWAGTALADAEPRIEAAEQLFRQQSYAEAIAAYQVVLDEFKALEAKSQAVLAEQTAAGDAALAAGDFQAALVAFTLAVAIDADDEGLKKQLARAEQLEEVLAQMAQAQAQERNGRLEAALETYRQAGALDPDWPAAAAGVARLAEAIRQRDFNLAMSKGFSALGDGDYALARAGFAEARQVIPESEQPADGLLQVEQAENRGRIAGYRQAAEKALAAQDWQAAIDAFEAAIAIEGALVFATEGLAQARKRLKLEQTLQRFVANPTLLQDDARLQEAQRALVAAARLEDSSAASRAYLDALAQLVAAARVQLPLTITSDNRTEVTILRVAPLGRLKQLQLALIPGRYVLVGRRQGYRDVRQEVSLLAHAPAPVVAIVCTERI